MKKAQKVQDEQGRIFNSLNAAAVAYGLLRGSVHELHMRTEGHCTIKGHTFYAVSDEGERTEPRSTGTVYVPMQDPLMDKLKKRYSDKELEQLANGEGIDKRRIEFPAIHLEGVHHRMVVISDTHIGSVYSPEVWHDTVSNFVNNNNIECVLHCGDLVDGLKISRAGTQVYELSEVGFEAQKNKAIELMSMYNVPIYIISGNHDMYFQEYAGANIVKAVSEALPNMTYIGHNSADITVDGCTIRLFHGTDGSSYALSYRLQKLVEAINGGHKPNIMLCGHVHKFCYILERNIHAISVPCMQKQTKFMEGKKLEAHTGFLLLEFDTYGGNVCNLSVKYYPFYA